MKKLMGITVALMMVFAFAGQASAYFEAGQLMAVVYDDANEIALDLGAVDNATGLYQVDVSALSGNSLTFLSERFDDGVYYDIYFALTDNSLTNTDAADLNFWSAQGGFQTTMAHYNAAGTQMVTEPVSTIGGYTYTMTQSTVVPGNWAGLGTDPEVGEIALDAFLDGQNMFLYQLRVDADGQYFVGDGYVAELTANAVPVPGAVWLLGSALLGIVGIRRKIKA
jgi:hypothetical protein